jgi:hypothetical protein
MPGSTSVAQATETEEVIFERPATPSDKVKWLTASAVPVPVLQMVKDGVTPAGVILTGPMGQKTYRGPIQVREVEPEDWRDERYRAE